MYLQSQGCIVVGIRDSLLDNPGINGPILEVRQQSVDAGLGIGPRLRPTQWLWMGTLLVTSNESQYWGGGRSVLLHIGDWNHPPLSFNVLHIPPLLFRLILDSQDVSLLKGKIFFIIPIKVKEGLHILCLLLPEIHSTTLPGSGNWFYPCCSVQILYFVLFQETGNESNSWSPIRSLEGLTPSRGWWGDRGTRGHGLLLLMM